MSVKPIPDKYHTVTPYLVVSDVTKVVEFLKGVFGAVEKERLTLPDGNIMHAEVVIGDSTIMLGQARGGWQPIPGSVYIYVTDTDATYRRAMDAGGMSVTEPQDQFYGDRNAGVKDPIGNFWWIATHIEDVPDEELQRRAKNISGPS